MADVQSNINVNIDTSDALASLKLLQRQISAFHTQMSKSGTAASAVAANQAQNLMNSINATGKFQASMRTVTSSTESFTNALEKNQLTSREYFRYTGAATKTFGKLFRSEFDTINKVARERVKDVQTQYIKLGRGANGALQAIAVRPLALDMKDLGTQTAIAAQKQQLLNQLLKQGSTNLLNFGKNTQWAGRQLMVGFTVPLVMLGTQAAKTFMQLEEQAIRFKRVYGEMFTTTEETDKMVKNVQLLAKEYTKYGVAVEKTMEMAANAAAMGKMGADLLAQVSEATRLAVLGGVEQEQALETTISVTNAFGVATEDLAKKIDFLNAVENQTVVSIEDLTIAIPKAGPVVQQLGGDVEDLAFFLTAMKEGGINASEGANALKSGLASLINPSEKASKMLMGLGVNIRGIVEANKGDVRSTVIDFAAALDTLDPLNRARAIEQLFGKFQFSRLSTLFQNVTKEGTQASRVLKLAQATTEELAILSERELARVEESTTYKFKKAMEDLKVSLAPVGEQFLKALTPIVEFVGKVLEKFNGLGDGSKKFLTIMTIALGAIGPLALMTFGLLANGVANIIKLFATLRSGFNKVGSSTNILGQQTDYLTQQQLEASAVAASLDQVHQRLRQTFTSETAAVNALAASYQRAIAAQAGFTGPARGGKAVKGLKKYSTGTGNVPGTGNQDTVPAMLTPGEAVIPAQAAQDPANRPVIARMIAGETVQGFNTGSGDVQPDGNEKLAFAHAAAPIQYKNVSDIPDEFGDKARGLQARGIASAYGYTGIGFDIPASMNAAMDKSTVDVRAYEAAIKNPESIKTMTAKLMDPPLRLSAGEALRVSNEIRSNLLASLAVLPDGSPINDKTIYSRMGSIRKGILGGLARDPKNKTIVQRMLDPHGIGSAGKSTIAYDERRATPAELREAVAKAGNANKILPAIDRLIKHHPDFPIEVVRDKNGNIVGYNRPEVSRSNPTKKPTKFSNASLVDGLFVTGRSGGDSGAVKIRADAKSNKAALRAIADVDGITTYGKKDTDIKDVGRSNPKHRHMTGVYETADGKGKVFVKPMINLENALAEQRAATILRDAHGLDVPEQRITMVKDPVTKRLVYALESVFDPKFAGKNMPLTFSQDEYFRQLLASALRGDKDLGKGNLGGGKAPDVGTAYVYDEATQYNQKTGKERVISDAVKSVGHQALINVGGVAGSGAKKFFADATRDIALSMSPDEYQRRMVAEIDRVLPKLRETIAKFGLTGNEAKPYNAIIERLEDARNNVDWKKIHTAHTTAGKVAITPDELILNNKSKKTRKPKKEKLPKNAQSSGGSKDTVMTTAPGKNEQVVKPGKPNVKTGKLTIRGHADAPTLVNAGGVNSSSVANAVVAGAKGSLAEARAVGANIGTTLSQSAAAASRTLLYGTGPIDAESKSVRRQLQKRQKEEAKTQAKAAASRTALYGTGPIDADAKSLRRQEERKSKIEKSAAYRKKLISERAILNAQAPMQGPVLPSGNFTPTKLDRAKLKVGKMKSDRKQARMAAGRTPGGGLTGAAMAASGVAMVGSMLPGAVGETMQKLMMPLMGLSMILPMLGSVTGALTVVMLAAVGTMVKLRMEFDKAQNEALKLANTMGSSKDAMRDYSKFAGTVTAGEVMQRRSQEKFGLVGAKPGKTTFGESFVQSETGKGLLSATNSRLKSGDAKGATGDLTNQLMSSVMSGALSADQAKSIALNIGQKTGNYGLGFAVTANINEIIGPNGENLEKEPLKIRMDLINAKEKQSGELFSQMSAKGVGRGGFMNLGAVNPNVAVGGTTAAGAGIGAAIGTAILPGIGTIIGTGLGAIAGAATGYFSGRNENKKAGQMSGAVVASQRSQLEQQQEMVDSLDLYYQKKLQELEVEGKISEQKELQKKYDDDRLALVQKGESISKKIMENYAGTKGNVRSAMDTGIDKMLTQRYEGTDEVQYLDAAKILLQDSGLTAEQQYLIKVKMSTGELTPSQQVFLFSNFGDNKEAKANYMDIVTRFSARTTDEATRVMGMFSNPDGTPNTKMQTDFLANVKGQTGDKEAAKYIDFFAQVANTNGVFDMTAALNYYMANPKVAEKAQGIIDNIEKNKGKLNLDVMTNFLPENVMGSIDTAYFDKLSQSERLTYLKEIATIVNIPDPIIQADPEFIKWQKEGANYNGVSYAGKSIGEQVAAFRQFQPWKVTQESIAQAAAAPPKNTNTSGNKVQSSPLDDLVKKLRDVRDNTIKVTEGWAASRKALDKLFGGKKTIDVFSGIENDLRAIGGSEDFIELIVGMDPKEYEKKKNSLFKFDNKGNIVALKEDAKNIQEALNSITMGDWNSDMESQLKSIENQTLAFDKLAKIGVPVADAYELISNKAIAASIANGVNEKTLNTLIAKYKVLKVVQEKSAAVENVKKDVAKANIDRLQEQRLKGYNPIDAFAIKSDDNLSSLESSIFTQKNALSRLRNKELAAKPGAYKDKLIAQIEAAQDALEESEAQFAERLVQLRDTIGLMEDIYNDVYSKGIEMFDIREQTFQIDFKINTDLLNKDIEKAQNEISAIQYNVDDKEAALKAIEDQEQKINERYDERIEALNKVEAANAAINAQQKGQLTLAEALTSGDIAAAARAAQDMRAQAAADAVVKQKDALEQSRKNELSQVTGLDKTDKKYKTRKQLEEEIKTLQDEIFNKEEDIIEPKQELIRLAEVQLKKDIDSIKVADMTRDQWEKIRNNVEKSRMDVEGYEESLKRAVGYADQLIARYGKESFLNSNAPLITEKPKIIPDVPDGRDSVTSPTPKPTPTPDPTPKPEPKPDPKPDTKTCPPGTRLDANGNCTPSSTVIVPPTVKPEPKACPPGTKSDGNGNCVSLLPPILPPIPTPKPTPSFKDDDKNGIPDLIQAPPKTVLTPVPGTGIPGTGSLSKAFPPIMVPRPVAPAPKDLDKNGIPDNIQAPAKKPAPKSLFTMPAGIGRGYSLGGMVKHFALGGFAKGTDTVPAMLTPGEFIMSKYAVDAYGVDNMKKINNGDSVGGTVYNNTYTLTVNAKTDANPNDIAQAVMSTIKRVDDRRIRGVSLNGR